MRKSSDGERDQGPSYMKRLSHSLRQQMSGPVTRVNPTFEPQPQPGAYTQHGQMAAQLTAQQQPRPGAYSQQGPMTAQQEATLNHTTLQIRPDSMTGARQVASAATQQAAGSSLLHGMASNPHGAQNQYSQQSMQTNQQPGMNPRQPGINPQQPGMNRQPSLSQMPIGTQPPFSALSSASGPSTSQRQHLPGPKHRGPGLPQPTGILAGNSIPQAISHHHPGPPTMGPRVGGLGPQATMGPLGGGLGPQAANSIQGQPPPPPPVKFAASTGFVQPGPAWKPSPPQPPAGGPGPDAPDAQKHRGQDQMRRTSHEGYDQVLDPQYIEEQRRHERQVLSLQGVSCPMLPFRTQREQKTFQVEREALRREINEVS
eukprot:gene22876-30047_t